MADTKFIFRIVSWFIGGDHSFFQNRSRTIHEIFPAEALRTFVYIEKISYAMTGSVIVILSHSPEWSSCQGIQIQSGTAIAEFCGCKVQVPTKYCCEIFLFFLGNRAKYNGAGDVCGSLQIMAAGIHQNQSLWFQRNTGFFCGTVMNNSSMCTVGNNGIKAVPLEVLLSGAELIEFVRCGKLGDLLLSHILFQPVDKFYHCHAVFDVGCFFILDFDLIFDGFWKKGQVFSIQDCYSIRNAADQTAVYITF